MLLIQPAGQASAGHDLGFTQVRFSEAAARSSLIAPGGPRLFRAGRVWIDAYAPAPTRDTRRFAANPSKWDASLEAAQLGFETLRRSCRDCCLDSRPCSRATLRRLRQNHPLSRWPALTMPGSPSN